MNITTMIIAAVITAQPTVSPEVLEPSVLNEVEHALNRAPQFTKYEAAEFGQNLNATQLALKLVSSQKPDGRWFEGEKDVTAAAIRALKLAAYGEKPIEISFAEGKWSQDDFVLTKAARFNYVGDFVQGKGCIENRCPEGVPPNALFKEYHMKVYSAFMHRDLLPLGTTVSSTMGWDWRMAPIIVIAPELGVSTNGVPEFREHWEVCLYDKGINLWHHFYENGKQRWFKAGAMELPPGMTFGANTPHDLKVTVSKDSRKKKMVDIECDGYKLYVQDSELPEAFYAGIIGCEGRNFFWDYKVNFKKGKK